MLEICSKHAIEYKRDFPKLRDYFDNFPDLVSSVQGPREKNPVDNTQPRKIASIVNCNSGACLDHIQAYLDHISSTFHARLDHVSRTNMLCCPVSKFMCRSQYNQGIQKSSEI
jgi:hypothetical protein